VSKKQKVNHILDNRNGGSIAIKGFNFQYLYACYILLLELFDNEDENAIQLEGFDDLDIKHKNEYIQVKTSKNSIDANKFWNMNVLKNNLELYKEDTGRQFRFVHNTIIAKGYLKGIENKHFTKELIDFWEQKLGNIDNIDIEDFFKKIIFEKTDEQILIIKCKKLLLEKFDLKNNTEEQYLNALLYHISKWSEKRKVVKYQDIQIVIQQVKDSASKETTNNAVAKNFIEKVSFNNGEYEGDLGYFDGKSAKPIHIAQGLPVRRKTWEEVIQNNISQFDITIIKASSGQGKSTLAWQVVKNLMERGYTVYQLHYCQNNEDAEAIYDFVQTRLKIGQIPLIVIDGLDQRVKEWNALAQRLFSLPAKIVITSREEDWYRYGIEVSKVSLKIVDILLFHDEAKNIFEQLKSKNKIHGNIKKWQPTWEKVESKGLLIEFVFLLTQGSMIEDRLETQIRQLNRENSDASVKLEILRLIALADMMNIKIQTQKLINYIQSSIGFTTDRGEVLKSLSAEYYIKFNKRYIEGLHPVRSGHLVKILHEYVAIEESLINLLRIIDNESLYDYAVFVPFFIERENKEKLLEDASNIIAMKSFQNMVDFIDGLMHYEPYSYWKQNKEIYEEVFAKGLINLFVNFNSPFSNLKTFEEMNAISKDDRLIYLVEKKNKLTSFNLKNTSVSRFSYFLSKQLSKRNFENIDSYIGLEYLTKWLHKTGNKISTTISFDDIFCLNEIKNKDLDEIRNFCVYYMIVSEKNYFDFIDRNKDILFAILKQKTNSLVIEETDNELFIRYLATHDNINKLNECSVKRIELFKSIFPQYNRFHTEALYLPFPNEELYKWQIQDSIKAIPSENLFDEFDVHLNVIWRKTIMRQYSYDSIFEWLEFQKKVRLKFLEFVKECNRLFEYILEGKQPKNIYPLYQEVFSLLGTEKEFPDTINKYNSIDKFKDEKASISKFQSPMRHFMDQFVGIIDKSDIHLPLMNLKDTVSKLKDMQSALDEIQDKTYRYFDLDWLKEDESYWYSRLLRTVEFYVNYDTKIQNARDFIIKWIKEQQIRTLKNIQDILENLNDSGYIVYNPRIIMTNGLFREVAIGIEGFEEDDLSDILFALVEFAQIDIDYLNIIIVNDGKSTFGFRVSKMFFEKIQNVLDGNEYEETEFGNPIPLEITQKLLDTIEGNITQEIIVHNENNNIFFEIMYDIWELKEYHSYLDKKNKIEKEWLNNIENDIRSCIIKKEALLDDILSQIVQNLLDNIESLTNDDIVKVLNKFVGIV